MTTTATSIHTGPIPPAQLALQEIEGTLRGLRAHPLEQTRHGASPVENLGHVPGRRSPERERPEDDEAVLIAVPATVAHRSFRERPEDDEVVLTYTSEPACRRMR
ncbi:hypothetical protein GCM10011374_05200 [Kocuria dechangensis]|uniref:Uncharacterized protein n=1 Tax=Kocuria dechangensis TaxID=1176249 RepID=A0A917GHI9_9MICC|nr:hypothetical protein [Kocuria dechangensis]GGG45838.1 hypothetical protein GCM10011374_05200 [Kocuria dechangensis]